LIRATGHWIRATGHWIKGPQVITPEKYKKKVVGRFARKYDVKCKKADNFLCQKAGQLCKKKQAVIQESRSFYKEEVIAQKSSLHTKSQVVKKEKKQVLLSKGNK
jgi:hypothetical protein